MALLFECTPQCARKVLDTAYIVREAIYRQFSRLTPYFQQPGPTQTNRSTLSVLSRRARLVQTFALQQRLKLCRSVPTELVSLSKGPLAIPRGGRKREWF